MTREQILEIDQYCQEHKMSYRQRLEELDIPFWNFVPIPSWYGFAVLYQHTISKTLCPFHYVGPYFIVGNIPKY